jgi:hypothetical protein
MVRQAYAAGPGGFEQVAYESQVWNQTVAFLRQYLG